MLVSIPQVLVSVSVSGSIISSIYSSGYLGDLYPVATGAKSLYKLAEITWLRIVCALILSHKISGPPLILSELIKIIGYQGSVCRVLQGIEYRYRQGISDFSDTAIDTGIRGIGNHPASEGLLDLHPHMSLSQHFSLFSQYINQVRNHQLQR